MALVSISSTVLKRSGKSRHLHLVSHIKGKSFNLLPLNIMLSVSDSCDPMDCSLPGSSVHGILQARILEWVAISFSRGSSRPKNQTWVSCIAGRYFTNWTTREALKYNISCCSLFVCFCLFSIKTFHQIKEATFYS